MTDEPDRPAPGPMPTLPERGTVTRHFIGWDGPALPAAAVWLLERGGEGESTGAEGLFRLDLSRFRVVLPGSRAARRLLELLVDGAGGRHLLPPDMVTVGQLPERLYRPVVPAPRPEVEAAAWRLALSELDPVALGLGSPDASGVRDPFDGSALAETVAGLHAQVGGEGHTFDSVADRCTGELLFNDEGRWRTLGRAQRHFRALLATEGLRDREGARLDALAQGLEAPLEGSPDTLVLVGVVDLPGIVRRFLSAWRGRIEALVHAPPEHAARFDAFGAVEPDAWNDVPLRIPDRSLRVVDRPDHQALAVVDHLRGMAGNRAAEEITVGVPDESLVPHLRAHLEDAGVPTRHASGRPLSATAPFLLVEAVADWLDGREFDAFAALVRHPDLPAALGLDLPLPAIADAYQAEHFQAVLDERMPRRDGEPLLGVHRRLTAVLEPVQLSRGETRTLAGWADPLRALMTSLFPDRFLDRGDPADRDLMAFARATASVLEGFASIPPSLDPAPVPAHRALGLLLAGLREQRVPPPQESGAVELLGWLELHLDDAREMIVTGVNEPFLPESVTGDPFLPHALRSRLGLADNRRRRARDLYLLSSILASRPGTLVVAGRRDASGNPLGMSRLLLADEPEAVARRIRKLLGSDDAAAGPGPVPGGPGSDPIADAAPDADPARHQEAPPGNPPFSLPPEPLLAAAGGPPDRIRVTDFRMLLNDPYRYALERILRLERVTDDARELDARAFGSLAHDVLERWARLKGAAAMTEPQIVEALDAGLDDVFGTRFGTRPLPALRIQREQLRARLHAYATLQAERNREGWVIAGVEVAPAGEGVAFPVDGVPILLRGRIDRVDHHPGSGRWQLLDIKSSEKARDPDAQHRSGPKAAKRWVDLQLPLYLHLARALRKEADPAEPEGTPGAPIIPPGAMLETGYILLPGMGEEVQVALAGWTPEELESAWSTAEDAVRLLRANRFQWDPGARSPGRDDPLAWVLGRGVLQDAEETGDE